MTNRRHGHTSFHKHSLARSRSQHNRGQSLIDGAGFSCASLNRGVLALLQAPSALDAISHPIAWAFPLACASFKIGEFRFKLLCQVPQAADVVLGYASGLRCHLRVNVEDGVGAVPYVEPFQAVAEGVAGYALQQEQGFADVGIESLCQVRICGHGLDLSGPACRMVAVLAHEAEK